MNIIFSTKKAELSDAFKNRVEKKLKKLTRFFGDNITVNVMVSVEKSRENVEITVRHAGFVFRAEETTNSMYESLDRVVEALVRQIKKNKTRLHKKINAPDFDITADSEPDEEQQQEEYRVVKSKKFLLKPISVEDAILQMNMVGHQFYMFKNEETEKINVVYRRNDGNYGLLQPDEE